MANLQHNVTANREVAKGNVTAEQLIWGEEEDIGRVAQQRPFDWIVSRAFCADLLLIVCAFCAVLLLIACMFFADLLLRGCLAEPPCVRWALMWCSLSGW